MLEKISFHACFKKTTIGPIVYTELVRVKPNFASTMTMAL